MRLCFISDPNSVHTRRWVNWFALRGHAIRVVADVPLKEPWEGVEVEDLSKSIFAPVIRFPIWAVMMRRILHRWQPDVLHAHRVNSAGWLGAVSGFHPLVVTAWGSDLNDLDLQPSISRLLASFVMHKADMITAPSNNLLRQAQQLGAAAERCYNIQWGIDLKYFFPGKSSEMLQKLGIAGSPVILSPRAIDTIYNIHILIAAMPEVLAKYPRSVLVLRDYNTNAAYKAKLLQQIADLGIEGSIRWLGRITPWEANAEVYRMADIAVSIPFSEGMAVSVWEAMACGLPVIASDLPGLREWITPGENGLLVPVGDIDALAQAIITLVGDGDMQNRFSQRGAQLAHENADHQLEMAKMEQLYLGLLQHSHDNSGESSR
jgi:glycosyltransferase involved in cell wall biosynthesis